MAPPFTELKSLKEVVSAQRKGATTKTVQMVIKEYFKNFGLNQKRLKLAKKDALVMHPGPINRGVEISSDVADSKNSIILDQVENGVAIRMAIIYLLAQKKPLNK